jgi:hypothetical protein
MGRTPHASLLFLKTDRVGQKTAASRIREHGSIGTGKSRRGL